MWFYLITAGWMINNLCGHRRQHGVQEKSGCIGSSWSDGRPGSTEKWSGNPLLTQLARPVGLGLKRQDGGLHAIMHLQLLQDIRHVMLDRFFRQVQLQPDLFIARAGRD